MQFPSRVEALRNTLSGIAMAAVGLFAGLGLTGCGTPGAPQPPSLRLPELVNDLTAQRNGNTVTLHWTMPKKTTDHLLISSQIKGPVTVRICRRESNFDPCQWAGETAFAAGVEAEFHETLPASLPTGEPRQLLYFVELKNRPGKSGRSAGLSNSAAVAAGLVPPPISGLTAEVRATGVVLHWSSTAPPTAVRLHRRLLTPQSPANRTGSTIMSAPPEPVLRDLFVDRPRAGQSPAISDLALDRSARFGKSYEYTAQRIRQITVDGKSLELASGLSSPITVDVIDNFPPAVPTGLAAVLVAEEKTIDLSWQPDTEEDLAGYIVYRAPADPGTEGSSGWTRISGPQPVASPAFRDTHIEAGHSYRYAISAIDLTGHESQRSAEARESVPNL